MNHRIGFGPRIALALLAGCVASATAIASNSQSRASGGKVTVRITATTRPGGEVTNGGVAGRGRFTAVGAIRDKGAEVTYRTKRGAIITLRYVTVGRKGTITFVVKIELPDSPTSQPTSRAGHRRLRAEPRRDWARR